LQISDRDEAKRLKSDVIFNIHFAVKQIDYCVCQRKKDIHCVSEKHPEHFRL